MVMATVADVLAILDLLKLLCQREFTLLSISAWDDTIIIASYNMLYGATAER